MTSIITISDILEANDVVCDIKYRNIALPLGLLIENSVHDENINEKYVNTYGEDSVDDNLYNKLLHNEKLRRMYKKTKKNRPLKFKLSLRNKQNLASL